MRSMTGYGGASASLPEGRVTVEVRALNQRFLDIPFVLPREYAGWESVLREIVRRRICRGRIEVSVTRLGRPVSEVKVSLKEEAARAYVAAWRKLKREFKLEGEVTLSLLQDADIFDTKLVASDLSRELPAVEQAVSRAIEAVDKERRREGRNMRRDLGNRVARLSSIRLAVARRAGQIRSELKAKVRKQIDEIMAGDAVDVAQLAEQVAYLIDKGDVAEEVVRMGSHLGAIRKLISQDEPVGRRIEFLLQEIHREVNTIGSKVSSLPITQLVVEAKGELERLREQVQNVE